MNSNRNWTSRLSIACILGSRENPNVFFLGARVWPKPRAHNLQGRPGFAGRDATQHRTSSQSKATDEPVKKAFKWQGFAQRGSRLDCTSSGANISGPQRFPGQNDQTPNHLWG
eukprot:4318289-Amphidinium_carterae.1